jgi:ribosome-associated heat shock protein Hsp15
VITAVSLPDERQRIDKWLWHARVVRTRSAAAALTASGHVRLNGVRVEAPGRAVKVGDVLTVALDRRVRVLKIAGLSLRRGGAEAGRALYDDLTPAAERPAESPVAAREPGAGRPNKQERRAIERLRGRNEY